MLLGHEKPESHVRNFSEGSESEKSLPFAQVGASSIAKKCGSENVGAANAHWRVHMSRVK